MNIQHASFSVKRLRKRVSLSSQKEIYLHKTENSEISYPEWLKGEEKNRVKGIWEGVTFR